MINRHEDYIKAIIDPIRDISREKNFQFFISIIFIIYLLGYAALLRAGIDYQDDIMRTVEGFRGGAFSRQLGTLIGLFFNFNLRFTDVSPLTQLFALVFLTFSSLTVVKVVNEKFDLISVLGSCSMGLFPYFLQNMSYKFDAPYMAFALLCSTVPMLYLKSPKIVLFLVSFFGVLASLMCYQAGTNAFLVLATFLIFKNNIRLTKNLQLFLFQMLAYISACIFYKIFILNPVPDDFYVSIAIHPLENLIGGVINNLYVYIHTFVLALREELFLMLFIIVIVAFILKALRNDFMYTILLLVGLCFSSFGLYLLMDEPYYPPRIYMGMAVAFSVCVVWLGHEKSRHSKIYKGLVILLIMNLISYCNIYGNTLRAQREFEVQRMQHVIHNISEHIDTSIVNIHFAGDIGMALKTYNSFRAHPGLKSLIHPTNSKSFYINSFLASMGITNLNALSKPCSEESTIQSVLVENIFHTIEKYEDCYVVTFHPNVLKKTRE